MEKVEELKNIKKKYKNYLKFIFIILLLLFIFFVIKFIYTYNIVSKILYTNYKVDLGDNYKITVYRGKEKKIESTTYYKNNVRKIVKDMDGTVQIGYCVDDKIYSIWPNSKVYEYYKNESEDEIKKISFINYHSIGINEPISNDVWDFVKNGKIKIGKEIEENTEYITMQSDAYKLWVDKETYLVRKEKLWGQITEKVIEKDVVTDEDVEMMDLSEYEELKKDS